MLDVENGAFLFFRAKTGVAMAPQDAPKAAALGEQVVLSTEHVVAVSGRSVGSVGRVRDNSDRKLRTRPPNMVRSC